MENTLFLSDLDGTLLGQKGELTEYTCQVIRKFVRRGGLFSIATARSFFYAYPVLERLELTIPVLLNNGAVIFHPVTNEVLQVITIPQQTVIDLYEIFVRHRITGFMYVLENNEISMYYQKMRGPEDYYYFDSRYQVFKESTTVCENLVETAREHTPMFFVLYGQPERLNNVYKELTEIPEIYCSLYEDTRSPGNFFYLDIFSASASKQESMLRLKSLIKAKRVVAFGDSYNDVDMLQSADESYATLNAVGAAKRAASNGIIGSCDQDGVARFLSNLL